jgi:hypothetical protein
LSQQLAYALFCARSLLPSHLERAQKELRLLSAVAPKRRNIFVKRKGGPQSGVNEADASLAIGYH